MLRMDNSSISYKNIEAARVKIAPYIDKTPFILFDYLKRTLGKEVFLKCENLQKTGSFKIRGATHCVLSNLEQAKKQGVIAASAGNHAQGVAAISQKLGVSATIVMPEFTPPIKVQNTKNWGAHVELVGAIYDEAYQRARQLAEKNKFVFVHPFLDPFVIKGQGTLALELLEEPQFKEVEAVVVSVGGGGLSAGVAAVLREKRPELKIYGVVTENAKAMYLSFKENRAQDSPISPTIAEGVATKKAEPEMVALLRKYLDDIFAIPEEAIVEAVALLGEQAKLVVEGSGALPLAAVLRNIIPQKKVAVILSGGNIDIPVLKHVFEKAMVKQSRLVSLRIPISDKPGGLLLVTKILAEQGANILQVFHQRTGIKNSFGEAAIEVDIETKGKDHTDVILKAFLVKNVQVCLLS